MEMVRFLDKAGDDMPIYNLQLETFLRVAEAGSFNKAAAHIHITPSAVIKQINLLENDLGLHLFERTYRGLKLTAAGDSLCADAKYIIEYSQESIKRARKAGCKADNIIRIGISPLTPAQFLIDLWPRIHEYWDAAKFRFIPFENNEKNAQEILQNLEQNIDVVAGIFDEGLLRYRQCDAMELAQEPICCAVSIHHRLAGKQSLDMQDLYEEKFMLLRRGQMKHVDQLRADILQNHPRIQIVDFDLYNIEVFNQCENGNHVLMAMKMWENVHPLLRIIPVEWDYKMPFGILHAPQPSAKVQHFLEALRYAVKTL